MTEAGAGHGDPSFDRYARMVCRALGVAHRDRHDHRAGPCRLPAERAASPPTSQRDRESPLSHSFCQHVVAEQATADRPGRPQGRPPARQPRDPRPRRDRVRRLADHRPHRRRSSVPCARSAASRRSGPTTRSRCSRTWQRPARPSSSERGLRDLAALGERAAQDLSHRSRVLLALSEGLSATRTMTDVAQAVEQIAVEQLGCLHAGIWLRGDGDDDRRRRRVRRS